MSPGFGYVCVACDLMRLQFRRSAKASRLLSRQRRSELRKGRVFCVIVRSVRLRYLVEPARAFDVVVACSASAAARRC